MIDRSLNYGRQNISDFASNIKKKVDIILDLGAGKGDDLLLFKKFHPNARLIAFESYPPNVEYLQERNIETIQLNIENDVFRLPDESVDVVIANQIMEHCKEVWWILHEVSRILKKDGSLVIGVPNLASFHNRILLMAGRQPTCIQNNSAHVRGYTKKDFLQLLNSGQKELYQLIDYKGSNFYPFPPVLAQPLSKLFPSSAVGIFFHLRKTMPYQGNFIKYPAENALETNFFLG